MKGPFLFTARSHILLSTVSLLCFLVPIDALPDELAATSFRRLSVDQGLSHSTVWETRQDRFGFLWVATQDGLDRFDGYQFRSFRHDPEDPDSLASSEVLSLAEDGVGGMWIGTRGGGLDHYLHSEERFAHYPADPESPRGLSHPVIWSLLADRRGEVWLGTEAGLDVLSPGEGEFRRLRHDPEDPSSLSSDNIWKLFEDRDGTVWIGTAAGLDRFDSDSGRFTAVRPRAVSAEESWSTGEIDQAPDGRLWLSTSRGLEVFDPESETFEIYLDPTSGEPLALRAGYLLVDAGGEVWLGTQGEGLYHLRPESGALRQYTYRAGDPRSLGNDSVLDLFEDRTGVLWIGSYMGLSAVDTNRKKFSTYRQQPGREPSMQGRAIWPVYDDEEGGLWVGSYERGLEKLDRDQGTIEHFRADPGAADSLPDDRVTGILRGPEGTLWVSSYGGVSRLDVARGTFETWSHDADDPSSLRGNDVLTIFQDSRGRFWVGTGAGVDLFDPRSETFTHLPVAGDSEAPPEGVAVYWISEGPTGTVWITSDGAGLFRLGAGEERFTRFRHDPERPDSLLSDHVATAYEVASGEVYAGTFGMGLSRYRPATSSFEHFREKDGLPSGSVFGILEGEGGELWLSTGRGLSRFDPSTETFTNYDAEDGLQSNVFSTGSAFENRRGELFFGGIEGLNAFVPAEITADPEPPRMVLTDLKLFNRSLRPLAAAPESPLAVSIVEAEEVVWTHRDYVFSFEFSGLHFANPGKHRYRYRLEGFDRDWIETSASRRTAHYANLKAGEYVFRAQGSNGDEVWSEEEASIRVRVLPPPWKTWWAYSLYGMSFLAALLAYSGAQKRKIERERAISERLREVDRMKDEFLANTSHELRTPLYGIIGLAESLIEGAAGTLPEEARSQLGMVVASGRRLGALVNDILDFSRLTSRRLEIDRHPVPLRGLVELVLDLSRPLVGEKSLRLINSVPEDLPAADADENRLQQILHNLIGNAIKFTASGRVEVSASPTEEGFLEVRVADTGIGISQMQQGRIFEAFEQADASTERKFGGTGLGLAVARQLVALHGGRLRVESSPGEGSTFSFTLPTAREDSRPIAEEEPAREVSQMPLFSPEPSETEIPSPARLRGGEVSDSQERHRVLIVDDEVVIRQVLHNYLASEGVEVLEAEDGRTALDLLEREAVDLVVLDVMMPGMSGFEVCRRIRERFEPQELPVLFLTAKSQASDLVAGFAAGGNDFLVKPAARSELLARLRTHLELRSTHRQLRELVSERTDQLRERQVLVGQLESKNAELERFGYTISHDLKNPLFTIKGFLGLARQSLARNQTERLERDLGKIANAADKMQHLLEELLEYSRLGHLERPLEPVDLGEVVEEALALLEGRVTAAGAHVRVAADLPTVLGNRPRLRELFQNLIDNAIKYVGDGGTPEVEITWRAAGDDLEIRVRDHGVGIEPRYHEKAFELFSRLDDAGIEGSGVGLASARRIVEIHGGRIWIESEGRSTGCAVACTLQRAPVEG